MTAEYWADAERVASRLRYIPLGRQAQPDAVASVIRFLASADASYMTGETVRVDGGSRLGMYNTGVRSAARLNELGD
jgi:NAD(P)-dependent dehydrogenase (short-subunit alcohol dehydrogenase family)